MGRDKASLPFGGMTILERILGELARAFDDLILVWAPAAEGSPAWPHNRLAMEHILHDEMPYEGPVGALARGFMPARHPIVFACSCDQPLVNGAVARALCAMLGGFAAVIPEIAAGCIRCTRRIGASGCRRLARDGGGGRTPFNGARPPPPGPARGRSGAASTRPGAPQPDQCEYARGIRPRVALREGRGGDEAAKALHPRPIQTASAPSRYSGCQRRIGFRAAVTSSTRPRARRCGAVLTIAGSASASA